MQSPTYAIVDIETTGHSPLKGDRMIQFAAVFIQDWQIQSTYTTFIQPGKKIPMFIQDLTHITDKDVEGAPSFEEVAPEIYNRLAHCIFVAHNTDFDLPFLQAEFKRVGLPRWQGKKMDTVELSRILFPTSYSYKLQDLATEQGIILEQAHRADDDAYATAELLIHCMKEIEKLPVPTIEKIHKRAFLLKTDVASLFFEVLQKKRKQASPENYDLYKGIALQPKEKFVSKEQSEMVYPETKNQKRLIFSEGLPNFKERAGQFKMMDAVWQAMQKKSELAIEAETGVGKTLSYLVPAFFYAKQQNKKVIISTYTAHLMEQLRDQEVSKLESIVKQPIRVALLKGANHYIDIDRFEELVRAEDDSYDETFSILQILVWLTRTKTGDVEELNVSSGGQYFLDKVRKTSFSKQQENLEHDFHRYALAQSEASDLLITNHAMLFSEQHRLEPLFSSEIGACILDEAHQFVQAANTRDERVFSFTQWKYVFGQLGLSENDQLTGKFFEYVKDYDHTIEHLFKELDAVFINLVSSFDDAVDWLVQKVIQTPSKKGHSKQKVLLSEISLDFEVMEKHFHSLQRWLDLAHSVMERSMKYQREQTQDDQLIISEWNYWINEVKIKTGEWADIFLTSPTDYSVWIELDRRSIPGSLHVYKKPIDSASAVQEVFKQWRGQIGIVWTSGTLTVPGNTRFIANQLGLPETCPIKSYASPEGFYNGANLFIVEDMPHIQQVSQSEFIESVADAVIQTVLITEGRCFVLFTSQDMLRKTVDLIQDSGLLEEYMLFAQGMTSGSRMRLLKSFQRFSRSVLFGTNSFWEGVDVPGEALSAVIVVRLPFSSPDEPIFKSRAEKLTNQGINSFSAFALPEAILRFRQGFGRLIRSADDRGVFIVLDRRIESKSYGKEFIRSLPPISIKKVSLEDMVLDLEHWYNEKV
jgi:ATP-dependent DNA helicase DinG